MSSIVKVEYSDFSKDNSVIEKIEFELLPDNTLTLINNDTSITLTMSDSSTENVELSGELTKDQVTNLIRCLSMLKNQMPNDVTENIQP